MINLLLLTIFLPLIGAGLIWVVAEAGKATARKIALVVSLATLACAAHLVHQFVNAPGELAGLDEPWLSPGGAGIDIRFSLGLDGLSVWLFGLSALLTLTSV